MGCTNHGGLWALSKSRTNLTTSDQVEVGVYYLTLDQMWVQELVEFSWVLEDSNVPKY